MRATLRYRVRVKVMRGYSVRFGASVRRLLFRVFMRLRGANVAVGVVKVY